MRNLSHREVKLFAKVTQLLSPRASIQGPERVPFHSDCIVGILSEILYVHASRYFVGEERKTFLKTRVLKIQTGFSLPKEVKTDKSPLRGKGKT